MMNPCATTIRVRYEETDRMGVAYYGNYFVWFEVARTEHFRQSGCSYSELEKKGIRLMVIDAHCTYKARVTYDDVIVVETEIRDVKNTSFSFTYTIRHDSTVVATGRTGHVFTDEKGKPTRIPESIRSALTVLT